MKKVHVFQSKSMNISPDDLKRAVSQGRESARVTSDRAAKLQMVTTDDCKVRVR